MYMQHEKHTANQRYCVRGTFTRNGKFQYMVRLWIVDDWTTLFSKVITSITPADSYELIDAKLRSILDEHIEHPQFNFGIVDLEVKE
jgi:formylmethanofuran dehydrogenase subunit B